MDRFKDIVKPAAEILALEAASMFAGGAVFVSYITVPSIREIANDKNAVLKVWRKTYKRGACYQGSLAFIAGGSGILATALGARNEFAIGGACMLLIGPYTKFVMGGPISHLLNDERSAAISGEEVGKLVNKWDQLHWGRIALSFLGVGILFYAARKPCTITEYSFSSNLY